MLARHAQREGVLEDCRLESRTLPEMPALTVVPLIPCRSQMHPAVFKLALLCWILLLAIFWVTFAMSANALFVVAIGTVYATVFFSVPYIMSRIGGFSRTSSISLGDFLRGRFETLYGPIGGREALMQVILVPFCVGLGSIAIGFIIHAARSAH